MPPFFFWLDIMPLDSDAIDELIDDVASGDKSMASNGKSLTSHDIQDLIALAKFRQSQTAESSANTRAGFGLRFQQITPVYR